MPVGVKRKRRKETGYRAPKAPPHKRRKFQRRKGSTSEPESELPIATADLTSPTELLVTGKSKPPGGLFDVSVLKSPLPAGTRASNGGKLHIFAVAVGAGNGCLVITPNNEIYIIDIGSDSREKLYGEANKVEDTLCIAPEKEVTTANFIRLLYNNRTLAQNKKVRGLILSHSDTDHYSFLSILEALEVKVEEVYFSNLLSEYSGPTASLVQNCIAWKNFTSSRKQGFQSLRSLAGGKQNKSGGSPPTTFRGSPLRTLTYTGYLSAGESQWQCSKKPGCRPPATQYVSIPNKSDGSDTAVEFQIEKKDKKTLVPYLEVQTDSGNESCPYGVTLFTDGDFVISALVSNYSSCADYAAESLQKVGGRKTQGMEKMIENNAIRPKLQNEAKNRCSIVTRIDWMGEVCIICGDATGSTQKFLMDNYSEETLGNVDYLCVPHHGATTFGTSDKTFADWIKPKTLVVSAARLSSTHPHPQSEALMNYLNAGGLADPNASVSFGWFSAGTQKGHLRWLRGKKEPNYFQFGSQAYRLYHTGWLKKGWHHYEVGAGEENVKFNNDFKPPFWRDEKKALTVQTLT